MRGKMTYIHERPGWPEFTWDSDLLAAALAAVRHKQGRLLGKMEAVGFDLQAEASLTVLTSEVVKSSAIEGENLNPEEVRSSIARRLGMDVGGLPKAGRGVDGIVEMMLDATGNFEAKLTEKTTLRLALPLYFQPEAAACPASRSATWRPKKAGPMQVVSGPIGREKVYFDDRKPTALNRK